MADPQFDSSFVHIDLQEIKECKEAFVRGGIAACESFLRKKAEEWKTVPLDIGIIGNSGTGKSSFINTIRGLTADDKEKGAAAVGVNETTTDPTPYSHPNNQLLKFWDLPGVGTPKFPVRETYLEKVGFAEFDFFLIMSKDGFTDNDQWLARAIAAKQKQFFFIRSHIDDNITNDKKAHPRSHDPEKVEASIRENIKENLGDLYRENGTFLIDNYTRHLYDFNLLEERIIEDLPSLKRAAFILSVSALSEKMVKTKVEYLRSEIWKTALLSGGVALIPIPSASLLADVTMIISQNQFYFKQLGLDDESLKKTAQIMNCNVVVLSQIVDKYTLEFLTVQGIKTFNKSIGAMLAGEAVEEVVRLVPLLGSLMAGSISAALTYKILDHVLTKLEAVALHVVKTAVKSSSNMLDEVDGETE